MSTNGRQLPRQGGAILWVLLILVVAAVVFLLVRKNASPVPAPIIAEATPVPATPVPATPVPEVVKATPTPRPIAVATPTPTPAPTPPPLDFATVARTPALWPPQVALLQPVAFPVYLNGRAAGEAKAPAGTVLRVLRIHNQQVEVEFQNARHLIPVASTDLMPRALAIFRSKGSVVPQQSVAANLPQATPPPATPALAVTGLTDRPKVTVTAERKKSEVVRAAAAGEGDLSKGAEKCVYAIKVQSRSFADLPALEAEYQMFVERQKLGEKKGSEVIERISGAAKIEPMTKKTPMQTVLTNEIELKKQNLVGNFIYTNGGRVKAEDSVVGIWVRVLHQGQVVAEYANPSTLTKRGWDNK